MDTDQQRTHPAWFKLEPEGPHRKSGGLGADGYHYEFYCAKDGHQWPCPAVPQTKHDHAH